jgi:hypothetical protein
MLEAFFDREHEVISAAAASGPADAEAPGEVPGETGPALSAIVAEAASAARRLGAAFRGVVVDAARVRVERPAAAELEAYLEGGHWRGKAGGYNLGEVRRREWRIDVDGDEATVTGLPMEAMRPWLSAIRRGLSERRSPHVG